MTDVNLIFPTINAPDCLYIANDTWKYTLRARYIFKPGKKKIKCIDRPYGMII